jgi:hypothetical protein
MLRKRDEEELTFCRRAPLVLQPGAEALEFTALQGQPDERLPERRLGWPALHQSAEKIERLAARAGVVKGPERFGGRALRTLPPASQPGFPSGGVAILLNAQREIADGAEPSSAVALRAA